MSRTKSAFCTIGVLSVFAAFVGTVAALVRAYGPEVIGCAMLGVMFTSTIWMLYSEFRDCP